MAIIQQLRQLANELSFSGDPRHCQLVCIYVLSRQLNTRFAEE
jgi:hypothetical protein